MTLASPRWEIPQHVDVPRVGNRVAYWSPDYALPFAVGEVARVGEDHMTGAYVVLADGQECAVRCSTCWVEILP